MKLEFNQTASGFRISLELLDDTPQELKLTKKSIIIFAKHNDSITSIVRQFQQILKKVK